MIDVPGQLNLLVLAGATFSRVIRIIGVDLTGWTGDAQARRQPWDPGDPPPGVPLVDFTVGITTTTSPGPGTDTLVTLSLTKEETAALDFRSAVWALELTAPGGTERDRWLQGQCDCSPRVVN